MKKALLATVAMVSAGYGVYRWRTQETRLPAPAAATVDDDLVTDRLWIDHIPRGERDTIQVFVAITEEPVGVFEAASRWKGAFEFFRYEQHGGELRILFPQTNTRDKVRAKATHCNKGGMDYCLELEGSSRGVKQYYSRDGWEVGSTNDVNALVRKISD